MSCTIPELTIITPTTCWDIAMTFATGLMSVGTIVLAYYSIQQFRIANKLFIENSLIPWRNSVITTLSEYLGHLNSLQESGTSEVYYTPNNIEKTYSLCTRIHLLMKAKDETLNEKMIKLNKLSARAFALRLDGDASNWQIAKKEYDDLERDVISDTMNLIEK
jgi:hypothetical protein